MTTSALDNVTQTAIRKERWKAYLTSGAICLLALVAFFFFHKRDHDASVGKADKLQMQVQSLQKELASAQAENKRLRGDLDSARAESDFLKLLTKPAPPEVDDESETVYVTDSGKKYHSDGCQSLRRSRHPMTKREAIEEGYEACGRCW